MKKFTRDDTEHGKEYYLASDVEALMAQPEQEPIAYLCENAVGHKYFRWKKPSSTYKPIALYTTPPKREWVGLTSEELMRCLDQGYGINMRFDGFAKIIEAKLKELNT